MPSRAALGALCALVSAFAPACASGSTPPAARAAERPNPATSGVATTRSEPTPAPALASVAPPTGAAAASAPNDAAAGSADPCRVAAELELAYDKVGQHQPRKQWIADARAKLLPSDDAERALTGISQEILSALAHRKYEKLAAFAGKEGICMRVARGAPCQVLSARALAGCAQSRVPMQWPSSSTDDDPPRYTCAEAFRRIFYARDFLHVGKPRFNCFAEAGGGEKEASIIASDPRPGYVELRSESADGAYDLWFVFDGDARAPELVEMISDHSGTRAAANP